MPVCPDTVLQQPPCFTNQPSFAHKKGGERKDLPVRQEEHIIARPQCKVDEDEVRRNSLDVMVCSCNSSAHTYHDECEHPYCQYWHCEGKEAGQKEQDMLCIVQGQACSVEMRDLHAAWRVKTGSVHRRVVVQDICHVCKEMESPAA